MSTKWFKCNPSRSCVNCKYSFRKTSLIGDTTYKCLMNKDYVVFDIFDLCRHCCNKHKFVKGLIVEVDDDVKNNSYDNKKKK